MGGSRKLTDGPELKQNQRPENALSKGYPKGRSADAHLEVYIIYHIPISLISNLFRFLHLPSLSLSKSLSVELKRPVP